MNQLRRRTALIAAAVLTTTAFAAPSGSAAPAPTGAPPDNLAASLRLPKFAAGRYVVTLADKPLATYQGGVAGLKATKPAKGRKVDTAGADAKRYSSFLTSRHNQIAAAVGAKASRHYSTAINAFAANLSGQQVSQLSKTPGVVAVTPDQLHVALDDKKPADFLKLSGKTGVWSALGGTAEAGKGVVVGVVDTGIWPESASLSGPKLGTKPATAADPYRPYRSGSTIVMHKADGNDFTGSCEAGEDFTADLCNTKLISAKYFGDAWLGATPPEARADYASPRDGEGHGTHTATTAAGRAGVDVAEGGINFGTISGVAPAAKIAVYKALWEGKDGVGSGGYTSDILAAIDQAVADGVDVINYSVGSIFESEHTDPVQLAFLSAASAGIFVSAAGGNSGPDASSLDNTSPWVTTVGASTVAPYEATAVLGNGEKYAGLSTSVATNVSSKPLITGEAAKTADATAYDASQCLPNTLDAGKAAGRIVVCDRGVGARVAKSAEVKRAGGVAMILLNLTDQDMVADSHSVPTVHLNTPGSLSVKAYAGTPGATAQLAPGNLTSQTTPYPQMADFSSRGPSLSSHGDLLKPDLAAPGVNVLAAVAPPTNDGHSFAFYSGTSMAAPHIAGLAALYLAKHPDWTPMMVKSALMTTTSDVKTASGAVDNDPFARGAGEVQPSRMLDPGLVYDSGDTDWLGYLEGSGVNTGTGVPAIDPSDYNAPSIAVGQLVGTQTITRRVTAVTGGLYRATVSVPGMKAVVTPSILNLQAGQTRSFTVKLTQDTAASNETTSGWLTWQGAGTSVRSPIVVVPTSVLAPASVSGTGASGQVSFDVTAGKAGTPIRSYGVVSAPLVPGAVPAGAADADLPNYPVTVTADTKAVQWNIKTVDPAGSIWMVLYKVVNGQMQLLSFEGDGSNQASATVAAPAPGVWGVLAITLSNPPGADTTQYTMQSNVVTASSGSALQVTPPVTPAAGKPFQVTAAWSGVRTDQRSIGFVEFPNRAGTVVTIN
ncbi:PA domain-containing protein [Kribbella voronezhensis]|uniref:PA domain-containing protein n=1 Tax=Kribbella voronezhensis TaxID=2512212 RepID=A0A4V6Q5Z9_9ACTN|nr:S8 family peptidase [Kribbella voronezhensis]TDU91723.1 PA domain-containing protein [Kribbella voronezhensis]